MGDLLWMIWTFILGAMPGFFETSWFGPVIPGPSNVTSVCLVLVALLLVAATGEGHYSLSQKAWPRRLAVALGVAATLAWAALILADFVYLHFGMQLPGQMRVTCFNFRGMLRTPSESFALTGWALVTLWKNPVRENIPAVRIPALFLGAALWPCVAMLTGIAISVPDLFSAYAPDSWGVLMCLASGILLCATCARMAKTGIRLMDLVALFTGVVVFRAAAEVANPFLVTFSGVFPPVEFLLVGGYLVLTGVGCALLWCASAVLPRSATGTRGHSLNRERARIALTGFSGADRLTSREQEVVEDTLNGLTLQQIAEKHDLSASTVGTYRHRAYGKLGVSKKRELIELVARASCCNKKPVDDEVASPEVDGQEICLSKRARIVAYLIIIVLLAYIPPNYVSLSFPPYGMEVGEIAPYLVGSIFLVGGIARWTWVQREGLCFDATDGTPRDKDEMLRVVFTALGFLAAGWVVSMAWLWPFSGFEIPILLFDWMVWRGWAMLGMICAIVALGAFCGGSCRDLGGLKSVPRLFLKGVDELFLRRPYHVALVGVGLHLFTLERSVYSLDVLLTERFTELCWLTPRIFIAVLLVLVGARVFHYKDGDEGRICDGHVQEAFLLSKGLSELQAKVVVLTLEGKTSDEIASTLYLAPGTVRAYRSRACKVLGLDTLSDLKKWR